MLGILMSNCAEYIEAAMAAVRAGAIVAPLNTRLATPELRATAEQAGLSAIVTDRAMSDLAAVFAGALPILECDPARPDPWDSVRPDSTVLPGNIESTEDDIAFLSYTSGSDGLPKGVALSHRNIRVAAVQRLALEHLGTSARILLPSAMAYTGGLIVSFAELTLYSGGRLLIADTFDPDESGRMIEQHGITHLNIASPVLERFVESTSGAKLDLSSLRSVCIGGATVSDRTLNMCLERNIPVAPSYGQSECAGGATFLRPSDLARKFGTSGQPHMYTEIRIRDDAGGICAIGEIGEIEIRSEAVMLGYWCSPRETADVLRDGWLRTGDLGSCDADGFLTVTGRKKQMIISGGLNVYPAEIERVFGQLPELAELVVLGVPDRQWGQVPLLVVHPTPGAAMDIERLRRHGNRHLADYKQPKYLVVRAAPLPRTASGKLSRSEIDAAYSALPGETIVLK